MQFTVRHIPAGAASVVQETASAASPDDVRSRFAAGGVVLSVARASAAPANASQRFDVGWWCEELRTLLRSGMTVVEAIEVLAAGSGGGARAQVLQDLLQHLERGLSLSRAMAATGAFAPVLVASITASERTSTLQDALDEYLKHRALLERLKRQAVSSAMYPTVVVTLGVSITVFLLTFVIPRFSRIYAGSNTAELSTATQLVLLVSAWTKDHLYAVLAALVAVVGLFVIAYRRGRLAGALVWVTDAWPALRRQVDHYRLATLYQSVALMFRGGYTLEEAMQVCRGLDLGARLQPAVAAAQADLVRGRGVAAALAGAGLTDVVTERMMAAGERSGHFDKALEIVAQRHATAFSTFIERVTRVIEPVLLLLVALVVGSIVVLMYMPIFDLASGLGGAR
jgi:general secretion pathway protein F